MRGERTSIQLGGRVTNGFCVADAALDAAPGPAGIQAVISTATSLSTISPALATELALTPDSVAEIRFAGEPGAQTVAVVSIALVFRQANGGASRWWHQLGIIPSAAPIILGMDFLEDGRFTLDSRDGAWEFVVRA